MKNAAPIEPVASDDPGSESATQALQRANRAMETLFDNAPLGIIVFDALGNIRRQNAVAQNLFFGADELSVAARLARPDVDAALRSLWRRALAGESIGGQEISVARAAGGKVDLSVWTALLRAASGAVEGVMWLFADITEQRQLKQQLLQSQKMESVGRLAGGVAHDFNNLLAVISGYSEGLLRRVEVDNPLRAHVEEIHRAAVRGAGLTRQLLAFSRRQVIADQPMNLSRTVASLHRMLQRLISDTISIRIEDAAPAHWIIADPGQMEQVLLNLALNARDAMPEGGELTIGLRELHMDEEARALDLAPGAFVELSVRDSGQGMSEETRSRLFEPFYTTKEGRGTGLGLSIAYGIVRQTGGNVFVESAPGAGSLFRVLIPRCDEPRQEEALQAEAR
jgi:PAS domain S-box-containing protein